MGWDRLQIGEEIRPASKVAGQKTGGCAVSALMAYPVSSEPTMSNAGQAKMQDTFSTKLPSSKVVVALYCAALATVGTLIVLNRSLDVVWVLMMIPVVTAAAFYPRSIYLLMLAYLFVCSMGVILLEPVKDEDGVLLTVLFVLGTGVLAEGVFRLISARNRTQEALRQAKNELEVRVAERTSELMRTIQMLRQTEERFSKAFHITPVAMAITDPENERIIDSN